MTTLPSVERLAALEACDSTDIRTPHSVPWPQLDPRAFHGVAGRYIQKIDPHTEADPAGILLQFLVMFGNAIGRGAHFKVEADEHHLNLFAVLVGASAKGRKGVSAGQAKRLFHTADSNWCETRIQHGLSSGEGLIHAVRDPVEKAEAERSKGKPTGQSHQVVVDGGETDKRLLVFEGEFASTLRVMKREGSTLSATIRNAWDTGHLRTLTKSAPMQATGAHISIIGHITKDELLRYLDSTEAGNGFGNRFLWCCVQRSKLLPEGGQFDSVDLHRLTQELSAAVGHARRTRELQRDTAAREIWITIYGDLSEGKPGLLGSMIARAEAQTMRLACLYALLDRSAVIRAEHLMAALALWTYCEDSAKWTFGQALGDPVADDLLMALRRSPSGMTRTEIRDHFKRHRSSAELERALTLLAKENLAFMERVATGGRPTERWRATETSAEHGSASKRSDLSSLRSLMSQPPPAGDQAEEAGDESDQSLDPTVSACDQSDVSDQSTSANGNGDESDQSLREVDQL